jgi:hypothetical protein
VRVLCNRLREPPTQAVVRHGLGELQLEHDAPADVRVAVKAHHCPGPAYGGVDGTDGARLHDREI